MGWQFSFNGQLNWTAAEANWRLLMEPVAATNYGNPDDDEEACSPFGTAPPGAPPAYRAGEANAMAAEQSDDDRPAEPAVRRSRYVDGEAAGGR